jgi:hypothetical protein
MTLHLLGTHSTKKRGHISLVLFEIKCKSCGSTNCTIEAETDWTYDSDGDDCLEYTGCTVVRCLDCYSEE